MLVFGCKTEQSNVLKDLQKRFQKISEDRIYAYYQLDRAPIIMSIEIDLALQSRNYEESFTFFIETSSQMYGKKIIISIPEGDNFQSIAIGFLNACRKYLNSDLSFTIHTDPSCFNIIKPIIEKEHSKLRRTAMVKDFVFQQLACSECGKFCYMPLKTNCCKSMICGRCGYRDRRVCSKCNSPLTDLTGYTEMMNLCNSAPYVCNCGQTMPFSGAFSHIGNCHVSEVECTICNEMTKLSNFIPHMRMLHMDRLKLDIELI